MESYIFWTFMLAVVAVLCAGAAVFVRAYLTGTPPSALLFRPKGERRLGVVDQASIDSRRKLILIRRDDVEHLLMTGGPVDVVIETGINGGATSPEVMKPDETAASMRRTPVFSRGKDPAAPLVGTPKL